MEVPAAHRAAGLHRLHRALRGSEEEDAGRLQEALPLLVSGRKTVGRRPAGCISRPESSSPSFL